MFYDGTKLLSLNDKYGEKPEIYICCGNRSSGKTTFFSKLLINRFLKRGEKFALLYRYNYELDDVHNKFFNDLKNNCYPDKEMTSKKKSKGIYAELFLNGVLCGYAITLNSAEQLKRCSSLLSDISEMLFDEFQSENNKYCKNEVQKFISIHTTLARQWGTQVKRLPVYMISNKTSLLNPYFFEFGISSILKSDCKFLRGDGYVLEQNMNLSAMEKQKTSKFNSAFKSNQYINYSSENVYLNDSCAFIECVKGKNRYIATLKYKNNYYSVREYPEHGILYCDTSVDYKFPTKISLTINDHDTNLIMLKNNDFLLSNFRFVYERGLFRFKNMLCRECIICAIKY